jgi:two-component system, cell cycle sensor histidine kinase and response regulator CckA
VRTRFLLREINDATGRSAAMVKRLLSIGRSQPAQKVEVNLRDVLHEMRGILVSLCGRRVQVVIRDLATHHTIWADRVQLEQAILNLVVNARDAMPDGGELFIGLENADTEAASPDAEPGSLSGNAWSAELAQVPGSLRLVVRDQGVGMDERTLQRIFEPFYTTKGSGGGTGLGLATVQSAVLDSDGSIKVDSVPGRGTCFEITFPVLNQLSSSEAQAGEDGSAQVSAVVAVPLERISGEVPRVDELPAQGQEAVREHQLVSRSHEQGAARTRRSPQEE